MTRISTMLLAAGAIALAQLAAPGAIAQNQVKNNQFW